MSRIRILAPEVADRIAAGEVVQQVFPKLADFIVGNHGISFCADVYKDNVLMNAQNFAFDNISAPGGRCCVFVE